MTTAKLTPDEQAAISKHQAAMDAQIARAAAAGIKVELLSYDTYGGDVNPHPVAIWRLQTTYANGVSRRDASLLDTNEAGKVVASYVPIG